MGANNYGQLGVGDKAYSAVAVRVNTLDPLRIAAVRAGQHSGALTEEGHLYLWVVDHLASSAYLLSSLLRTLGALALLIFR